MSAPWARQARVRYGTANVAAWVLICLVVLALAAMAWGRDAGGEEGLEQITRRGSDPIDQIARTWERWRNTLMWTAAVLLFIVALKIISPFRIYDRARDGLLKRAIRDVDDLLKRIEAEAETVREDAKQETAEEGLLGGLAEVAEFTNAEQVPSYVLTVNDLMLDNIVATLKKLRKFSEGNAPRYKDYLFSVIKGIKTITEQSAEGGVSSGLAVDIREYVKDERRHKVWHRLLARHAKKGPHQDVAEAFLLFMRNLREGRPLGGLKQPAAPLLEMAASLVEQGPEIPDFVNEETLPAIQRAAAQEARDLCSLIRTGTGGTAAPGGDRPPAEGGWATHAWQLEFVRRQQQIRTRDEARRMLAVFLNCERKALREITKIRMLPCRTWAHVLRMLGVESSSQLQKRVQDKLLTTQEIIILEKAFLQTFARKESLARVYGRDNEAGLMIDLHVPQIRREALESLRLLRRTEPAVLNDATQALNEEETPQNNAVSRLIAHHVQT